MDPASTSRSKLRQIRDLILAVLFAAGLIYVLIGLGSTTAPVETPEQKTVSSPPAGSEGQLVNGRANIPIAIDEELVTDLSTSPAASEVTTNPGLSGRIFYVTPNTSVRISETDAKGVRVRILTGSQKGRLGWVPSGWVKPL